VDRKIVGDLGIRSQEPESSLYFFYIFWHPAIVDGGFGGAVEPENGEVTLTCGCSDLVGLFARGSLLAEVDVGASIGVLGGLVEGSALASLTRKEFITAYFLPKL
jgi:hypothetical protein